MSSQPDRIRQRLIAMGVMDGETSATRHARVITCRGCHRPVMQGINSDWGGYVVQADPSPLDQLGEALALLAGRKTYELRWLGDRYEIDTRDHFRIKGTPAGTNGVDIIVRHDCTISQTEYPQADSVLNDYPASAPINTENPPF